MKKVFWNISWLFNIKNVPSVSNLFWADRDREGPWTTDLALKIFGKYVNQNQDCHSITWKNMLSISDSSTHNSSSTFPTYAWLITIKTSVRSISATSW